MGEYNVMKPFGSNMNKVTFGKKMKYKTYHGPSPGDYDPRYKLVKPKTQNVKIHEPQWVLIQEAMLQWREEWRVDNSFELAGD